MFGTVQTRPLWCQSKGRAFGQKAARMQSSDQALHNFFKTGAPETQTTLHHPLSVLQNFLSQWIYEYLHGNSIINVAE